MGNKPNNGNASKGNAPQTADDLFAEQSDTEGMYLFGDGKDRLLYFNPNKLTISQVPLQVVSIVIRARERT